MLLSDLLVAESRRSIRRREFATARRRCDGRGMIFFAARGLEIDHECRACCGSSSGTRPALVSPILSAPSGGCRRPPGVPLDLDNVAAHVGEQEACRSCPHHMRHIENLQPPTTDPFFSPCPIPVRAVGAAYSPVHFGGRLLRMRPLPR